MEEMTAATLAQGERRRLEIDVSDPEIAGSILEKAGFAVSSRGQNGLVLSDAVAVQHPDKVATLLVQAGCAPTRLVVEQGGIGVPISSRQ